MENEKRQVTPKKLNFDDMVTPPRVFPILVVQPPRVANIPTPIAKQTRSHDSTKQQFTNLRTSITLSTTETDQFAGLCQALAVLDE
jgi:hypothetical protein